MRSLVLGLLLLVACATAPPARKFGYTPVPAGGGGTSDGVTITGNGSAATPFAGLPSSASNAGTMSAANFSKLSTVDYDGWFATQVLTMTANAPSVTNCRVVGNIAEVTNQTPIASVVNDGNTEGGSYTPSSAGFFALTRAIFQTPKTKSWTVAFRASFAATVASENDAVGVLVPAASTGVEVGVFNSVNSGLTYQLVPIGGSFSDSGVSNDAAAHDFIISFDTTTLKLFIDNVQRASTTTLTNMPTNPVMMEMTNTTAGHTKVLRAAFCYVAP